MLKYWPILICGIAITAGSLGKAPKLPQISFNLLEPDKIAHFLAYLVWTMAASWTYSRLKKRSLVAIPISISLYGVLMELGQLLLTSGRMFDWADALANTIGAFVGWMIGRKFFYNKTMSV